METPGPPTSEILPDQLTALAAPRWAVIGIFLILLVASMALARVFLVPVVLGIFLALVFSPVRRFLERRGVPSALSACLIVFFLVILLSAGAVVLSEPVKGWIEDAPAIGRQLERKVKSLLGSAPAVMEAGKQVNKITAGGQDEKVQEVVI